MTPPCTCGHEALHHLPEDSVVPGEVVLGGCSRCGCAVYTPSAEPEPDALVYGW